MHRQTSAALVITEYSAMRYLAQSRRCPMQRAECIHNDTGHQQHMQQLHSPDPAFAVLFPECHVIYTHAMRSICASYSIEKSSNGNVSDSRAFLFLLRAHRQSWYSRNSAGSCCR